MQIKSLFKYFGKKFKCPVCGYKGAFQTVRPPTGIRKYALCPKCRSGERHRLQYLVLEQYLSKLPTKSMAMLHFAPEPFFTQYFSSHFDTYVTADLYQKNVDYQVDLQQLPFADGSYDVIFASHVLEHVQDDMKAINEIKRVLRSSGIAILPVPIVSEHTIEYPEPNPNETYHVRAPGRDYFDRYLSVFRQVDVISSQQFPEHYQLYIYEDRSNYPVPACPLRQAMYGHRHLDYVPICYM